MSRRMPTCFAEKAKAAPLKSLTTAGSGHARRPPAASSTEPGAPVAPPSNST